MSVRMLTVPPVRRSGAGFTLLELMIVVVIVGILAAVAYPSYLSQVRKSRRADAVQALAQWQQAQERWRANNATYGTTTNMTTATPTGMGLSSTSAGTYYTLAISSNSATGYTLTATAVSGKSQAGDTNCTILTVTVTNGTGVNTPTACWSR